ncbi:MAG: DUF951 domain-containing protein [Clostridiales bacterium]|nr:DUF951 domain-containing protein [Clostridiales bacterium]
MKFSVGDIVQTKKKHPCGNDIWKVIRIGADYKIKCEKCGRIVMLDIESFQRRVKRKIEDNN